MELNVSRGLRELKSDDVRRLKDVIHSSSVTMMECDTLLGGMNDTIKDVAKELGVKPALLKKAIRIAYKNSMDDEREKYEILEDLLTSAGYIV